MERKNISDFQKFCGSDMAKLKQETDPEKRLHLMRRINSQMYAEACKQNYDDYTICQMLSDNLDDYTKESVPYQKIKFEEMMKKLNMTIKPVTIRPPPIPVELLKSKKCPGNVCKNDQLLNELDTFFNSMKKKPVLPPPNTSKTAATATFPNPSASSTDNPFKINVDESNDDLVFDLNFRRKKNINKNFNQPEPSTSSGFRDSRITDNRFSAANFPTASKRKQEESGHNFFKKTAYLPKAEPENEEDSPFVPKYFKSAAEELAIQYSKKHGAGNQNAYNMHANGAVKRSLGGRRTVNSCFKPPFAHQDNNPSNPSSSYGADREAIEEEKTPGINMTHPRLRNVDPKMIETIQNEIMDYGDRVEWDSIAGLENAKSVITEAVILPILRPDIFTGLRRPPRGVLLFGPPGTGKTLICKCIASQSESTFFSISASSLTSKWIGEGEKMVRALFAVAAAHQPSVVFIDEVDSLLSQRSENEHESSRRLKTEFLVQLDGAGTSEEDRILIVGATNMPQELDEAARRRFVKRLYIPLPEQEARRQIMVSLLKKVNHVITESHLEEIARRTDGYSGADMKTLCEEAVMGPVRSIPLADMKNISAASVRPVNFNDFMGALNCVRASVSPNDLQQYIDWNNTYGSGGGK